ncbi:MAG TPA: hypothetical protein VN088_02655 [Nocardioides sp.]|nr:hypothetical protein [Nocardioides sp.]
MTQAPPAPAAAPVTPGFVDTPALLRRLNLLAVATVVLFGLLSALVQVMAWQSDGRAAGDTEQLVRVQDIRSSLFRADALATNGYLLAGLEPTDRQHEYDAAISDVLEQIADAAEAQPADRAALAALNVQVDDYTTNVAQAAVYNRQGLPLGIAYQTTASNQLNDQALPIVDNLVAANARRSEDAMAGHHPLWLLGLGMLAVVALFLINRRLAAAFRRRINTGVGVAAAIVLVTTVIAAVVAVAAARSNHHTEDGAYRDATQAAIARTAANAAKADESLRLISRGSGSTIEPKWQAQSAAVDAAVPPAQRRDWDTYVQRHREVVRLDDGNQWKKAVDLATTEASSGSSDPLDAFDRHMAEIATTSKDHATDQLRSGRTVALVLALLTALLGLVAALAASRGIAERHKEFL